MYIHMYKGKELVSPVKFSEIQIFMEIWKAVLGLNLRRSMGLSQVKTGINSSAPTEIDIMWQTRTYTIPNFSRGSLHIAIPTKALLFALPHMSRLQSFEFQVGTREWFRLPLAATRPLLVCVSSLKHVDRDLHINGRCRSQRETPFSLLDPIFYLTQAHFFC